MFCLRDMNGVCVYIYTMYNVYIYTHNMVVAGNIHHASCGFFQKAGPLVRTPHSKALTRTPAERTPLT